MLRPAHFEVKVSAHRGRREELGHVARCFHDTKGVSWLPKTPKGAASPPALKLRRGKPACVGTSARQVGEDAIRWALTALAVLPSVRIGRPCREFLWRDARALS
jgi:hypothetical protein